MVGRKRAETLMFFMGLANKIAREMLSRPILSGSAMDAGLIEAGGGYCFRTLERRGVSGGQCTEHRAWACVLSCLIFIQVIRRRCVFTLKTADLCH